MAFFNETQSGTKKRRNWQDTFVMLTPEHPSVVQIIEPKYASIWRHWIPQARRKNGGRGIDVVWPGMDICPICIRNKELPDRDHPDYIGASKRYVINVLDLTPRKQCPLCETVSYTNNCSYCGTELKEVEKIAPEVRLLERGRELFDQLNTIEDTIVKSYDPKDPTNDPEIFDYSKYSPGDDVPVGIMHYPITLKLNEQTKKPTPVAGQINNLNWRDWQEKIINFKES